MMLDDPIDPAEQQRRAYIAQMEADALRHVLSSRIGRRFVHNLMRRAGIDGTPFTGDNNSTNYNCGRQSVATDLKADILAVNGDAFILMIRETKEDDEYVNGTSTQSDANNNHDYDPTRQHDDKS